MSESSHNFSSTTRISEIFSPLISVSKDNKDTDGVCCCNTSQLEAIIVIGVSAIITGILWNSSLLGPIKLVAVFLHEFSHASATWLTCGSVSGIQVS